MTLMQRLAVPLKQSFPFVIEAMLRMPLKQRLTMQLKQNFPLVIETKLSYATKIPYETEDKASIVHPRADTKMFRKDWHA